MKIFEKYSFLKFVKGNFRLKFEKKLAISPEGMKFFEMKKSYILFMPRR
jgi:hypothetical protein